MHYSAVSVLFTFEGQKIKSAVFILFFSPKLNTWALYNWTVYICIYSIPSQLFFALEGLCDCFSSCYLFTTFPPTTSQALNRSLVYPSVNCWKVSMAFWSISALQCVAARWCRCRRLVEAVRVEYLIGITGQKQGACRHKWFLHGYCESQTSTFPAALYYKNSMFFIIIENKHETWNLYAWWDRDGHLSIGILLFIYLSLPVIITKYSFISKWQICFTLNEHGRSVWPQI